MSIDLRETLITTAKHFHERGWMEGTAGNLSARLPDGSFWITASGRAKGQLTPLDFIRMTVDGTILEQPNPESRPSAETSIHLAIYHCFPESQACYHVHSVEANLVSRFSKAEALPLPAIEMLKGLGIWDENPQVTMPLFPNHHQVPQIAEEIRQRFQNSPPQLPALLIRDHGVTVWAPTPATAYNYIEVSEYIFRYMIAERKLSL